MSEEFWLWIFYKFGGEKMRIARYSFMRAVEEKLDLTKEQLALLYELIGLKFFSRSWKVKDLDSGMDMIVHPITGDCLSNYSYEVGIGFYFIYSKKKRYYFSPVWEGKSVKKGDAYPDEWNYDPYTGEWLARFES